MASHTDGETIAIHASAKHAVEQVKRFLQAPAERLGLARAGHEMVSTRYSKEMQWRRFEALVAALQMMICAHPVGNWFPLFRIMR